MRLEIDIYWDGKEVVVGKATGCNDFIIEAVLSLQDTATIPENLKKKGLPMYLYGCKVEGNQEDDKADSDFYKHPEIEFTSKRVIEAMMGLIMANSVIGEELAIIQEVVECSEQASVE